MSRLEGRTAIITGGASGIGAASVRLFVDEGARVVIADAQEDRGEALAGELGESAVFQKVDVSVESDVRAVVDETMRRWGRLDCIYNNAGFGGALGPIEETTVEEFDITFDVLVKGVFLGIKYAAPAMRAGGGGSIISTASVAGLKSGESPHLYSVAKAAVIHLTKSVALELGADDIRVNCICPGIVATPLAAGRPEASDEALSKLAHPSSAGGGTASGTAGGGAAIALTSIAATGTASKSEKSSPPAGDSGAAGAGGSFMSHAAQFVASAGLNKVQRGQLRSAMRPRTAATN